MVVALGLAACGWPGSGFWRYTAGVTVMPSYLQRTSPSWQAQGVMAYVPGGPEELAPGQVLDWQRFALALTAADPAQPTAAALAAELDAPARAAAEALADISADLRTERGTLLRGVNAALLALPPPSDDTSARDALAAELPGVVAPAPPGSGGLFAGGRSTPEVESLIIGRGGSDTLTLDIPWHTWLPTLRLWVGTGLALGLASLCLALIVHPQWSRRELLAYPIAQLVSELTARAPHRLLPEIARSRLFWIGLASVFAIHLLNGLNTWFETNVYIDLTLPFYELRELFPYASQVPLNFGLFSPRLYFTVIAFAFFLPRNVSFSVGIAELVFVAVGAVMLANGAEWGYEKTEPSTTGFLRFGAFVGMAVMIAYTGRRYYTNVAASAVGFHRLPETPRYAPWAARGLVASVLAAVYLLTTGGLAWDLAVLMIALFMLSWLVLSRVVCETGTFFITNPFLPATILMGLMGFEAIGPTGLVVATLASWIIIADPREAVLPFLSNALQILDRGGVRTGRGSGWLVVALVLSMLVAGFFTLAQQHQQGLLAMANPYATEFVPSIPFNSLATRLGEADALGTLSAAMQAQPITRFASLDVDADSLTAGLIGLVLVLLCAVLRLRVPWWPIHPILFVMWGTYALACFSFSFLLGWMIKSVAVRVGGARSYATLKPLMVGLISGELLAVLFWSIVGAAYYFTTGLQPAVYQVFPG